MVALDEYARSSVSSEGAPESRAAFDETLKPKIGRLSEAIAELLRAMAATVMFGPGSSVHDGGRGGGGGGAV